MNIVILEDEQPAYNRLVKLLKEQVADLNILAHFDSITDAKHWVDNNDNPDIIFMDIHLADGSAFELFKELNITSPVIFTTAYDQYAIEAFKTSGIAYLLKPIKKEELALALNKLEQLSPTQQTALDPKKILESIQEPKYKTRFLVRFGDTIKTIPITDIAYFFSENKATFARTYSERTYPMDNNLDTLEQIVDPEDFFRVNRQYIISLNAITDMKTHSKARVIVKLKPEVKEPPIVSSERSASFKLWLAGELHN